jgi:hypothetical protein
MAYDIIINIKRSNLMADVLEEVKQHLEAAVAAVEAELEKAVPLADLKNKLNEAKDALEPAAPVEATTEAPTEPVPSNEVQG